MNNEVTVIFRTKLEVDISFSRRSLWSRLKSIAVVSDDVERQKAPKRTVTSTLKMALMSEDFPEPLCYDPKSIFDRHLCEGSMCAPSLQREFGIYE
jgi:hypothetical protein